MIVIQEWWGLVDQLAGVADRLAGEGFTALAPDLYGGRTTHDADEAPELMSSLETDQAARDLGGSVDFLLSHEACSSSKLGAVGFCMGGGFVLHLAAQQGDKVGAAVPYYAVFPTGEPDYSGITAPVLGHFGGDDDFCDKDTIQELEQRIKDQAGVEVTFHIYDGAGHAFFNETDPFGTYDKDLAERTWTETVDFLRSNLS